MAIEKPPNFIVETIYFWQIGRDDIYLNFYPQFGGQNNGETKINVEKKSSSKLFKLDRSLRIKIIFMK